MIFSARIRIVGDTVKFEALAVLRLTTSSNLVGCSTGMSAGFRPLRMRSTISAPRRHSFVSGEREDAPNAQLKSVAGLSQRDPM